jgi:hypothetical protein
LKVTDAKMGMPRYIENLNASNCNCGLPRAIEFLLSASSLQNVEFMMNQCCDEMTPSILAASSI